MRNRWMVLAMMASIVAFVPAVVPAQMGSGRGTGPGMQGGMGPGGGGPQLHGQMSQMMQHMGAMMKGAPESKAPATK